MIAEAKLKWIRERNDEGNYYWTLYITIGRWTMFVAEVSSDLRVWLGLRNEGYLKRRFGVSDDAKAYAEKRAIKHFGLKEN